jgi:2-phospho-L-lactate guanylyltransferase (CobY/MobA/RfbA family)
MLRKDRVIGDEQRWHGIGAVLNAVLLIVPVYREETQMAKKSSESSRPARQIRVSAEAIWNKPLTERQKAALDGVAKRQKRLGISQIDYSDIPALTEKQLAQFRRPPKKLVAVRLGCRRI